MPRYCSADRFYPSASLFEWLHTHGRGYRRRLKGDHGGDVGRPEVTSTGDLARGVLSHGECGARLFSRGVGTNIGILHEPGHEEPWIIAMDCPPTPLEKNPPRKPIRSTGLWQTCPPQPVVVSTRTEKTPALGRDRSPAAALWSTGFSKLLSFRLKVIGGKDQNFLTAGTIVAYSKFLLTKRFLAMDLLTQQKNAISALASKRHLGMSYPLAWSIQHMLPLALLERDPDRQRTGVIEIDDVY